VTFRGLHLIGAYRILTPGRTRGSSRSSSPPLRLDYTDPNTSASNDQGILITPVLNL